ncbi:MAG: ribosomal protein S18-alanine N-acetyltransferase [Gammaproteobacteria bacterium]|nr:ribosomal protein S18-alanine N-acetyltransferase [Gammaproteobacteria bacterium]MBQ0840433.1 ribosomal protein S18-alanine N-acetyltransferase [Gammaproteobacteria bacterium]
MTLKAGFALRLATLDDIAVLIKIESEVSPFPWNAKQFTESLHKHRAYVLCKGNRAVAFLIFNQVVDEAELLNIAVKSSFQGEGLGAYLLDYCLAEVSATAVSVFLEVRVSNFPAIALYEGRSFRHVGERKAYYHGESGREDALVMRCDIESPPAI